MDNLLKKKLIACILLAACVLCLIVLVSEEETRTTVNLALADSTLVRELESFNIPADKYRSQRIEVDTVFYRKNYHIQLPLGLSKTWFHAELARKLYDHGMSTWANVYFPEQDMDIHILSNDKVIRSLHVSTDTSYSRRTNPAVVMMYFDRPPSEHVIRRIEAFGEPIAVVLRVWSARQAETWYENLEETSLTTYFWMMDEEHSYAGAEFDPDRFLESSSRLNDVTTRPGLLFFQPAASRPDPAFFSKLAENNIGLIHTEGASIISHNNRFEFEQEFGNFFSRARRGERPAAIIRASDESLDWFSEGLTELKKGGIVLARPATMKAR